MVVVVLEKSGKELVDVSIAAMAEGGVHRNVGEGTNSTPFRCNEPALALPLTACPSFWIRSHDTLLENIEADDVVAHFSMEGGRGVFEEREGEALELWTFSRLPRLHRSNSNLMASSNSTSF